MSVTSRWQPPVISCHQWPNCFVQRRDHNIVSWWDIPPQYENELKDALSRCVTPETVSWYFEPSQPQSIISGLKTNFSLSPSYSAHKSSNQKFSKIYKISPDTNLHKAKHTYTSIKHKIFEDLVPSVLPLFRNKNKKKHIRLGHTGIMDPSVDLSVPDFFGIKRGRMHKSNIYIFFFFLV